MESWLVQALVGAGVPPGTGVEGDTVALVDGRRVQGATGADWIRRDPSAAPEVAVALGTMLARLRTVELGPADDWPDRWRRRLRDLRTRCRAARLDLGRPLDALLPTAGILPEDRLPDQVPVHGALTLRHLWLDPALRPVTLLGIEQATPGDGLVDVATTLRFREPTLRRIASEAAGLRDGPGVEQRLGAYLRGDVLAHLLTAPAAPVERARHQEVVRLRLEEVESPRRALTEPRLVPDHPAVAARMALEAVGAGPVCGAAWVGAMAAALLAVGLSEGLAARFGLVGVELAQRASPGAPPGPPAPAVRASGVRLARRAAQLLDHALGEHILQNLQPVPLPPIADVALQRAHAALDAPALRGPDPQGAGLPPTLLERVVDDPLDGARACLPAVAWAGHLLAARGWRTEGEALLQRGLQSVRP